MIAQHYWYAGGGLPPDQSDLDLFSVGLFRHDRGKPAFGEVGSGYSAVRLFELFTDAQRDRLKMRLQQVEVGL